MAVEQSPSPLTDGAMMSESMDAERVLQRVLRLQQDVLDESGGAAEMLADAATGKMDLVRPDKMVLATLAMVATRQAELIDAVADLALIVHRLNDPA